LECDWRRPCTSVSLCPRVHSPKAPRYLGIWRIASGTSGVEKSVGCLIDQQASVGCVSRKRQKRSGAAKARSRQSAGPPCSLPDVVIPTRRARLSPVTCGRWGWGEWHLAVTPQWQCKRYCTSAGYVWTALDLIPASSLDAVRKTDVDDGVSCNAIPVAVGPPDPELELGWSPVDLFASHFLIHGIKL